MLLLLQNKNNSKCIGEKINNGNRVKDHNMHINIDPQLSNYFKCFFFFRGICKYLTWPAI